VQKEIGWLCLSGYVCDKCHYHPLHEVKRLSGRPQPCRVWSRTYKCCKILLKAHAAPRASPLAAPLPHLSLIILLESVQSPLTAPKPQCA
jgi:hypothetical protein